MKKQILTLLSICAFAASSLAQSPCSDLFISEYVLGSGNNRALELYNPTNSAIDLSNYQVGRFRDGSGTPMLVSLSGMIQPNDTYVIALDKRDLNGTGFETPIDPALEAVADTFVNPVYVQANSPFYFTGDDAVPLIKSDGITLVDLIGKIGEDPGTAWSDANGVWWTTGHTLVRKATVQNGVTVNPVQFVVEAEWDSLPENTFSSLGWHVCDCSNFCSPTFSSTTISNCGDYTWNNSTYSQSGTYTFLTTSSGGCDSTATLELDIIPNYSSNESYVLCGGQSVTVGGTIYSQEGQYSQTIPGVNGCDTVLNISVSAEPSPNISILGNSQITANSSEAYAIVEPVGYDISWSVTNGTVLSGQGTVSTTIFWDSNGSGEVSVTVSNNDCSYIFSLPVGLSVGISENDGGSILVQPNPSTGIFGVLIPATNQAVNVSIYDMLGKEVYTDVHTSAFEVDLSNQANGTYTMKIVGEAGFSSKKLVKQ